MAGKEPKPQGYLDFWGNTPNDPTTAQGKTFAPVSSGNSIAKPRPAQLKGGSDSIQNQILQAADYYGPMIYQKLGFFSSLELSGDQNLDFIPISQTKANTKLFVVGIIPPSTTITGRLLDRSASVGSITGYPTQNLDFTGSASQAAGGVLSTSGSSGGPYVTAAGYSIDPGSGSLNGKIKYPDGASIDPASTKAQLTNFSIPQLYSALTDAYRAVHGTDPTPTEIQFYAAQSIRETTTAPFGMSYSNNFGNMVNYGKTPPTKVPSYLASDGNYYRAYDNTKVGAQAFIRHLTKSQNVVAAAQGGDVLGYITSLAQTGYFTASVSAYYSTFPNDLTMVASGMRGSGVALGSANNIPKSAPSCCAFNQTQFQYMEKQAPGSSTNGGRGLTPQNKYRFNSGSTYGSNCPLTGVGPQQQNDTNSQWAGQGAANASAARKDSSKTVDMEDLNKSALGKKFMEAQFNEILATQMALDVMQNTPPLQLLVNPQSFKLSSEKVISDGGFTREGPIIEQWGEQQDKLEASGKLAAFMAIDANPPAANGPTGGGPGLTRVARNYSASYQNFLSLYLLYRNNGGLYTKGLEGNLLTRLSLIGSIYIYYDSVLYIGSFDSFSITETDSNPYSLEYSFQFTVRSNFMLDSPSKDSYQVQRLSQSDPALNSNDKQFTQQLVSNTGGGSVSLPSGFTGVQG